MTRRLTRLAHAAVGDVLGPGDLAVDATAGNGHDTAFLAGVVGPAGTVLAFDIQQAAIAATRARLEAEGSIAQVDLFERCHSELVDVLPADRPLRAAMFNLGYLPGSDKQAVTRFATTECALKACLERLGKGGILSVMAYRGHPGGQAEASAVAGMIGALADGEYSTERHAAPDPGPVLWLIRRNS